MKKFFIQDVKEGSQQAAYMFIAVNVVFFVGGVAEIDYGNFDNVLQFFSYPRLDLPVFPHFRLRLVPKNLAIQFLNQICWKN